MRVTPKHVGAKVHVRQMSNLSTGATYGTTGTVEEVNCKENLALVRYAKNDKVLWTNGLRLKLAEQPKAKEAIK